MEIIIAGHKAKTLQKLVSTRPNEFDALIITDVETPFPHGIDVLVNDHHWLRFDDVTQTRGHYLAPTSENVRDGLEWASQKQRDKLVVACHAGISRSSAMALLIAYQSHGDPDKSLAILDPTLHWPNPLVVKLGCELLEATDLWNKYTLFNIEKLRSFDQDFIPLSDEDQAQEFIQL